jgi:UDP-N-acetylglucosamine diphosphorylase / glucose-1-phosphate thymidylyltransferase / UDP-N-acetylgalactosamine diphosphorylase / glucosamine-1-phosphate N-acetyltransferase / galactosamine-1-phosphate N-acetyltransferase
MPPLTLIMPMAGHGTRFSQAGYTDPKPLIPVNGVPMFVHSERCIGLEFTKRIFITRAEQNLRASILEYYPDATVVELDTDTAGTACTLLSAREHYENGGAIFIANCDQHVEWNTWLVEQTIKQHEVDGVIAVFPEPGRNPKWSYAKIDSEFRVYQVAEKDPISDWATVGFYYWRDARDFIAAAERMIAAEDRVNGEFYTCPVYNYAAIGKYIRAIAVDVMQGIGTPEDLERWLNS